MIVYAFYHEDECVYVGSTKRALNDRMRNHKYSRKTDPKPLYVFWREILFESIHAKVLQDYGSITKPELLTYEKEWISKLSPKYNNWRPIKTREEHLADHRIAANKYYQNNKEKAYAAAQRWKSKAKPWLREEYKEKKNTKRRAERALKRWLLEFKDI